MNNYGSLKSTFLKKNSFHTEESCPALPGFFLPTMHIIPPAVTSLINILFYPHSLLTSQMTPVKTQLL